VVSPNPILVASADGSSNQGFHDDSLLRKQDFDRLDIIRKYYATQGVVGPMSDMLSSPIRQSSASTYDSSWHRWVLWCLNQRLQVHPIPYDPLKVIAWFSSHPSLAYSTIPSHISGLASVWGAIHPEKTPVAKYPLFKRYLQARRRAPRPLPQISDGTWDVRLLLDHVANWGDTDKLYLVKLQDKTILLLTIGTMWRPRSDIGRLQCEISNGSTRLLTARRSKVFLSWCGNPKKVIGRSRS
jgi:hypothetical protein